jgi:hypothetical protein
MKNIHRRSDNHIRISSIGFSTNNEYVKWLNNLELIILDGTTYFWSDGQKVLGQEKQIIAKKAKEHSISLGKNQ